MNKRYNTDALFQRKKKDCVVRRYHTDHLYQRKKRDYIVRRYKTDGLFQKKMKGYMVRIYTSDSEFRSHHILLCTLQKKQKCLINAGFHILCKLQCVLRIKRKYPHSFVPARVHPIMLLQTSLCQTGLCFQIK